MPLTRNQSNAASQAKFTAENSESSTSKETGDQGGSSETEPPRRDSPENCSICLGPFNNKSFTSSCAHSFCFVCLKQWSKVKAECPLCKQPFTSIFHNIRSNQHYDIYELPHQPNSQIDYNFFNYVGGTIPNFTGPTHHLFSLPQPAFDADLTLSNFSRFQFRHRRYDRYLNPLSIHGEHPYSFSGPAVNPSSYISATTWPRGAEEFRREVYRRNIGPPAVILGCENSSYRLTPAMVAASAHRIHRIMPWLTRELRVLLRSHQNVRLAISIIQPLLTQVTIDSMYFYDKIVPLIGHRSRQFVQEFVAFTNSALSVQAFDRKAMYRRRETAPAAPSSSSSPSSENDVVEVTDISPEVRPAPSAARPSETQPLDLARSGWDSPTPGPSWTNPSQNVVGQTSIIDRVSVSSESDDPVYRPDLRGSDSDDSKPGSDIIFVKYDKPWNERSPIKLTSDSEGGGDAEQSRKKKKSKHKKKNRELVDASNDAGSSKRDKSKKSRHRDKSKGSSKAASDEEKDSASCNKRHHSQSSTEQPKVKKHKKSKSRKEKLSDREIVDRYFAEAMAEQTNPSGADNKEADTSNKRKEKQKSGNTSSKEKAKKKKKSRKHSKDSQNQSYGHTYKKHHSGHKKSSNRLNDNMPEGHSRHKHSPVAGESAETPGRASRHEAAVNDNSSHQNVSSSPLPHSMVSGFQPPYLSMADTVQHIPVNLWVSTWPALSVSHTYPPPPSTVPHGQNIPQNQTSNASTVLPSNTASAGPSRLASDMLSISSDSSSDSSDSESDDAQDLQIPSLQNVHSRTKQWLETNFPDLGRPQTSSASAPTSSNASSATNDNPTSLVAGARLLDDDPGTKNSQEIYHNNSEVEVQAKGPDEDVEVVSIPSGEEDIVVCSSEDSCSNVDDLWVIDIEQNNKRHDTNNKSKTPYSEPRSDKKGETSGACSISTLPFQDSKDKTSSSAKNIILPPVNTSFQPFKLQPKSALSRGKDPFFPSMSHSSDEDVEVDNILQTHSSSSFISHSVASEPQTSVHPNDKIGEKTGHNLEALVTSTLPSSLSSTNTLDIMKDPLHTRLERDGAPHSNNLYQPQKVNSIVSNSATSTALSSDSSPIFSVLPPLTSTNQASAVSSAISYLSYPNLTPPTSVSSLLPCYMPQSSIPPSLPLRFPFPQIPPLLSSSTQPDPITPTLYNSENGSDTDRPGNSYMPSISFRSAEKLPGNSSHLVLRPSSVKDTETDLGGEKNSYVKEKDLEHGSENNFLKDNPDRDQQEQGNFLCLSLLTHTQKENESILKNSKTLNNVAHADLKGNDIREDKQRREQAALPFDFLECQNETSFEVDRLVHEEQPQAFKSISQPPDSVCGEDKEVLGSITTHQHDVKNALNPVLALDLDSGINNDKIEDSSNMSDKNCQRTIDGSSEDFPKLLVENDHVKPFDICDSISVDVTLQDSVLPVSESLSVFDASPTSPCIETTVSDRMDQPMVLTSGPTEHQLLQAPIFDNQASPSQTVLHLPQESLVDKNGSGGKTGDNTCAESENKSLLPFTDALASSSESSMCSDGE